MFFIQVVLMVLISGTILVDAGKKNKLLKKLKKEGYDLKEIMEQVLYIIPLLYFDKTLFNKNSKFRISDSRRN